MSNVPTIGRRVYYWPPVNEVFFPENSPYYQDQQTVHWEAGIIWVYPQMNDGRWSINGQVTGPEGVMYTKVNKILAPDRASASPGDFYWMPYQVKAAKAGTDGS